MILHSLLKRYLSGVLNPLVVPVLSRIIAEQPDDVVGYLSTAIRDEAKAQTQRQREAQEEKGTE